jgi:hypothetical protein
MPRSHPAGALSMAARHPAESTLTRVTRWSMVLYTGAIVVLALAISIVAARFELTRPTEITFGDSVRVIPNLRSDFVIAFAAGGLVAGLLGVVLIVKLARGRTWPLYLVALGALGLIGALFGGDAILRRVEGVYYAKSPWVSQYLAIAYPLATASAAAFLLIVVDRIAARARRGPRAPIDSW